MAHLCWQHIRRLLIVNLVLITALANRGASPEATASAAPASSAAASTVDPRAACDKDNGGLKLPDGFCASIFADNLGHARHISLAANGDLYVNTWSGKYNKFTNAPGGFIVALRDADRDGRAEKIERFGPQFQAGKPGGGTGIVVRDDLLFVESEGTIVRYRVTQGALVPTGEPETIVGGLPLEGDHPMHPFAIAADGALYVNSGSASNSCQEQNRTKGSRGKKPCSELSTRAGIWRYDANKTGQTFSPAERLATGARNTLALAVHPSTGVLYAAIHGRDQLFEHWPELYTQEQSNEQPAEILAHIEKGQDFGWPYCYFDATQKKQVLGPEYGGDGGKAVGECAQKSMPEVTFPAHWAPEALAFSTTAGLPANYQNGAFVTFHGSWNRSPTQAGFVVSFVPFRDNKPAGTHQEFASGFAGATPPADAQQAPHRPMGIAIAPDGAIYVSDDVKGRIWRIVYADRSTTR